MLTVIAYGTEKQAYFDLFMASCHRFGINPVFLGWGERWLGSGEKLISICRYIEDLPADEIILSVDPFDVVFMAGQEEITSRFREMDVPFLCGALKLRAFNARIYRHEFNRTGEKTPETATAYRFLNAGTWISTAGYALKILKPELESGKIGPCDIDQEILTGLYIKNNSGISIDWKCKIFHNLLFRHFISRQPELSDIQFKDRRIWNKNTETWPSILHASGNTRMSRFVSELGYDPSLSRPIKDVKNYTLKACFHMGKVLRYAVR